MAESNKMLIDATHPEETRVVVLRGGRVEEFDYESAARKQLRGNIYLAKVTRVEPSLQAAFVDYGGNRHGFLAFNEIHPDYYQIPVADRQALIEEEAAAEAAEEAAAEARAEARARREAQRAAQRPQPGRKHDDDAPRAAGDADDDSDDDEADADEEISTIDTLEGGSDDYGDGEDDDREEPDSTTTRAEATGLTEARLSEDVGSPADADPSSSAIAEATAPDDTAAPGAHDDHENHEGHPAGEQSGHAHGEGCECGHAHADAGADTTGLTPEAEAEAGNGDHAARRNGNGNGNGNGGGNGGTEAEERVEQVGAEDALEELPSRPRRRARNYKIQEVIKRRQVILVQVVKEERGNKGAALTTYLSLAGRYTVLMPNTARGGGISRKITQPQDRKRLKAIAAELEVPEGMGLIIRTAGAARTKQEIKRDFEYLLRLWESVRDLTLQSTAPSLVYEEGNLIKRSIRDLYNKDVEEVIVAGDEAFVEARDFMRMLMPSHAKNVINYQAPEPLFTRYQIERQLNAMFSPYVTLRSGGYLVINQTEALVAVDVNSGKSTREFSIEETALNTNLEAADEIARQLKLRDLAGLIVIDFIDMEEKRNNRNVERRLKDALRFDRARIQVGRISHFGLMEMSRQRLRTGVLEGSTSQCPHCQGTGIIRSVESVALAVLRGLEDAVMAGTRASLTAVTTPTVALYILNKKRVFINDMETRHGLPILVEGSDKMQGANFAIEKGPAMAPSQRRAERAVVNMDWGFDDDSAVESEVEIEEIDEEIVERDARPTRGERSEREPRGERAERGEREARGERSERGERGERSDREDREGGDGDGRRRRRRRRRGRRGERDGTSAAEGRDNGNVSEIDDGDDIEGDDDDTAREMPAAGGEGAGAMADDTAEAGSDDADENGASAEANGNGEPKRRRRRGRRGGRRNRDRQERPDESGVTAADDADGEAGDGEGDEPDDAADHAERARGPHRAEANGDSSDAPHADAERARASEAAAPARRERANSDDAAVAGVAEREANPSQTAPAAAPHTPDEEPGTAAETQRTPRGEPVASAPRIEHVVMSPDEAAQAEPGETSPARKGWWQRRFGG